MNKNLIGHSIDLPIDKQFVFFVQKVISINFAEYKNSALAVILRFDNGETQVISINLPIHAPLLEEGEFFLKNYSELEELAKILFEKEIIRRVGKIEVPSGFVRVPIVRLSDEISGLVK
jgi:hypothetical protein